MESQYPPFRKYGSIPEIGSLRELKGMLKEDLQIFEKVDGGLCQIRKGERNIIPGVKSNYLRGALINKNPWFGRFLRWTYSNQTLFNLPKNMILFGEWSGHHTIDYESSNDKFFFIDLFDLEKGLFVPYNDALTFLKEKNIGGIERLTTLESGKVEIEAIEKHLKARSALYNGRKEGVVIKAYNTEPQKFVKFLNEGFKEKRAGVFGSTDPFTEARIRKNIFKGLEAYSSSELDLPKLFKIIQEDVERETHKKYYITYIEKKTMPFLKKMFEREGLPIQLR
jgi:hypothetical protein